MLNKGFFAILMSAMILGICGVLIHFLGIYFSVYEQVILRSVVVLILSIGMMWWSWTSRSLRSLSLPWFIAFIIIYPLNVIFFTRSVILVNPLVSIFLLFVGSIVATFIVWKIFFDEKTYLVHWVSLVLCLVWFAVFAQIWDFSQSILLLVPGLLSWISEGIVHAARRGMGQYSRYLVMSYQFSFVIVVCVVAQFLIWWFDLWVIANVPWMIWLYGLLFGLLLFVTSWLLLYGFRHYDVNKWTVVFSSEILFVLLFNLRILSIYPSIYQIIWVVFVTLAMTLPVLYKHPDNISTVEVPL